MIRLCKQFLFISVLFFCFLPTFFAQSDYTYLDIDLPNVQAQNILLYNLKENKIIYEQNSEEQISIASLTKIMTALVAIETFDNLEEIVTVPSGAFYNITGYAEAGFHVGDRVTIKDLIYGTLLPSGAEAAQALAILASKNLSSFVEKMNEKANSLGMLATSYENPVGRDNEKNYSTLDDLATLLLYALENPTFYEIYTTRHYITLNQLEFDSTLVFPSQKYNLNIDFILGSKSGYTSKAGLCLSSIAEYHGTKYLLITAGSNYENGFPNHIVDSLAIYNYFFENFSYQPILKKDDIIYTLEIKDGFSKIYEIKSDEDISLYLKNDSELEYIYNGLDSLTYKVKTGDKLGEIAVKNKGTTLYTYDVFLHEEISYKYTKFIVLSAFLVLLFLVIYLICKKKKNKRKKKIKKWLTNTVGGGGII